MMRVCYTPEYVVPLPEGHPFPMPKFSILHDILLDEGLSASADVVTPQPAPWEVLRLIHTAEYLDKLANGTLLRREERRMGLPWSERLVRRSRLAVGGTIQAARMALEDGLAANLAGGTHHAFPDHGEGFCVLNDVAVMLRLLLTEETIGSALVIDLDVHHGNGTAACFPADPDVYTFSMHGAKNYPWRKPPSSRDVGLPDDTGDDAYLAALAAELPALFNTALPDLVVYLAGVDPVAGDRFGRLALSKAGLYRRDVMVLEAVQQYGVPVVLLMGGGYAATPYHTADLHAQAHRAARAVFG